MSIPESVLREIERAIEAAEFPGGMNVHDGKARVDSSHLRRLLAELAALRAELEVFREREAATAQGVRWLENESKRIERRAEKAEAELAALRAELAVLRNNQLGPVPEGPLKALGAWVADHTDDDTWPNAERYLNAALAEMEALRERVARLVGENDAITDLNQTQFLELEHLRRS